MTVFTYPADEHHYRDQTASQGKLPGVTGPSFVCARCTRVRRTKGRKHTAAGWWCADCHQAREYARAVKAAKQAQPA